MNTVWALSSRFVDFLDQLISESDFAPSASTYYPSVLWSLGGTMQGPEGVTLPTPPRYEVGLVERSEANRFKLRLPSKKFGYIIFDPRPEDAASSRRLIDFDGKDIVVR